jgi:hypothetical protein
MALAFALGSLCFLIGPFPGYIAFVGPRADAATFFAGSLLFTTGGALQCVLAYGGRHDPWAGRHAWRSAVVQSVGTLCFNVTTFRALQTTVENPQYDKLVWRPDAIGSACFLVSAAIAYRGTPRGDRWVLVNVAGCVFFGLSAVAGHVVPQTGSVMDLAAANWTTCLGAACFAAGALHTLRASPEPDDAVAAPAADAPVS